MCDLRKHVAPNMANFDLKNDNIGGKNSPIFKDSYYISK